MNVQYGEKHIGTGLNSICLLLKSRDKVFCVASEFCTSTDTSLASVFLLIYEFNSRFHRT